MVTSGGLNNIDSNASLEAWKK